MAARGIAGLATNAGADKPFPITYLALEWLRVGGGTTLGGCRITARDSLGAIGSRHRDTRAAEDRACRGCPLHRARRRPWLRQQRLHATAPDASGLSM